MAIKPQKEYASLLALRLTRLRYLPPAVYSTEILSEEGVPITVFEYGFLEKTSNETLNGVQYLRQSFPFLKNLPTFFRSPLIFILSFICLIRIVDQVEPKIIAAHGLWEEVAAWLLQFIRRVPYYVHVHEIYESQELSPFNRFLFWFEGKALRKAQFLIFPEKTRKDFYSKKHSLQQTQFLVANCPRYLPQPTKIDLRKEYELPKDSFLILFIGGIGKVNALDILINALSEVPKAIALIYGYSNPEEIRHLKKIATKYTLQNRIIGFHPLSAEKKWQTLTSCDLGYAVYHPSVIRTKLLGTASNKITECLAAGIPMVTRGGIDFTSFVEKNNVGVCLNQTNKESLVATLQSLIKHADECKKMGANGRRLYENEYHYEKQFFETKSYLLNLLNLQAPTIQKAA